MIFFTKKIIKRNGQRINYETNRIFKALQEGLGGIRDVLIDVTQEIYCNIFNNSDLPLRRAAANIGIITNSPRFVIESLGMVLIAIVAFILSRQTANFASAIPILGALALGAQRLLAVLQNLYKLGGSSRWQCNSI